MATSYSLFQPEIFNFFRTGYVDATSKKFTPDKFFATAMAAAYRDISASFDCSLMLSEQRLEEARQCWLHDVERVVARVSHDPDHIKLCGLLAYWMQRRTVVDAVQPSSAIRSSDQIAFLKFGNEVCAFMVAFRLATYFQFQPSLNAESDISARLKALVLDSYLLQDITRTMRYKSISADALFLILAALFIDIKKPRTQNVFKLVREGD